MTYTWKGKEYKSFVNIGIWVGLYEAIDSIKSVDDIKNIITPNRSSRASSASEVSFGDKKFTLRVHEWPGGIMVNLPGGKNMLARTQSREQAIILLKDRIKDYALNKLP